MKKLNYFFGMIGIAVLMSAALQESSQNWASNLTRSPFPATGAGTQKTATTAGTVNSGALNKPSQYMVVCTADVYLRFGASSDSLTADSATDFRLPADTVFFFATGGSSAVGQVAFDTASGTSDCRLLEAR